MDIGGGVVSCKLKLQFEVCLVSPEQPRGPFQITVTSYQGDSMGVIGRSAGAVSSCTHGQFHGQHKAITSNLGIFRLLAS